MRKVTKNKRNMQKDPFVFAQKKKRCETNNRVINLTPLLAKGYEKVLFQHHLIMTHPHPVIFNYRFR